MAVVVEMNESFDRLRQSRAGRFFLLLLFQGFCLSRPLLGCIRMLSDCSLLISRIFKTRYLRVVSKEQLASGCSGTPRLIALKVRTT